MHWFWKGWYVWPTKWFDLCLTYFPDFQRTYCWPVVLFTDFILSFSVLGLPSARPATSRIASWQGSCFWQRLEVILQAAARLCPATCMLRPLRCPAGDQFRTGRTSHWEQAHAYHDIRDSSGKLHFVIIFLRLFETPRTNSKLQGCAPIAKTLSLSL